MFKFLIALHAKLVYLKINYELLLYFKLASVVIGNVSKKGEKYETMNEMNAN